MTLQRLDNVLIVVDDLEAAKAFFVQGLLRQPQGFEGFSAVGEDMGSADLPVFEVVDAMRAATLRGLR